ncbi:MAG: ATPase [Paenibacillus sp.]|jgi:hypothetical protein|nr:ATPase [Paenibacillus sp.]
MFRLGQRVVFVNDSFELHFPVGESGYIIAYDRNADNVFDYVVRVPRLNKHFFVPAVDIELEEILLQQEAEQVEREALIDYALVTKNEELFRFIMNGEMAEPTPEISNEVQSREDFIKQINLKAWI